MSLIHVPNRSIRVCQSRRVPGWRVALFSRRRDTKVVPTTLILSHSALHRVGARGLHPAGSDQGFSAPAPTIRLQSPPRRAGRLLGAGFSAFFSIKGKGPTLAGWPLIGLLDSTRVIRSPRASGLVEGYFTPSLFAMYRIRSTQRLAYPASLSYQLTTLKKRLLSSMPALAS